MVAYKHMNLSDRIQIEQLLSKKTSLKGIGRNLARDCKTISGEIKGRRIFKQTGAYGRNFNDCQHRFGCPETEICGKGGCKKKCCFCGLCHADCSIYKKEICKRLWVPPYVCNGCDDRQKCTLEKAFYNAKAAQQEYEEVRSEVQGGIVITENEAKRLDSIISPLVLKGQSIRHIFTSHADNIMLSEKTVYNYFAKGVFSAKNIDLPRRVRFRPRKSRNDHLKQDKACRTGRTYADFMDFLHKNPDISVVQSDTVEGVKGGSVLLTIHFIQFRFMLAFWRDANTAHSVQVIFDMLYSLLGHDDFTRIFPLCLVDNGSEYSNPSAIEQNSQGEKRTIFFYCDPNCSFQKGAVENNHSLLRRIIPKGKSFDGLTQKQVALMMNHINSYSRKSLNGLSPYEAFRLIYGESILKKLDAELIPADDITLHPSLLK